MPLPRTVDITADEILLGAVGALDVVVVVGYDLNGNEYFMTSEGNGPNTNWLLDRAKFRLLNV